MSKQPPRRRRHLSKDDETVWEHMAASLKPLRVKKGRHIAAMPDLETIPPFEGAAKLAAKLSFGAPGKSAAPPKPAPKAASQPAPPALNSFDRKSARKLRQGQIEIDARIDLHGMRQHEAHSALRRFLVSAYGRGQRWVLVITGKGGPRRPRDDDEFDMAPQERGILRRNVPIWLAEPELRAIVVSFTTAAISHGGEGALYIQLRNPERAKSK
jgi:DNA-nicking Smr family endonuclease